MSTFDYATLRDDVLEILEEFGNAIVLQRPEDGANYNPKSGKYTGGVKATLNGTGVLVGFKKNEINGTAIRATDRKLLYQGDALEIGDIYNNWRVHNFTNIDPDESGTILVIAQMRK